MKSKSEIRAANAARQRKCRERKQIALIKAFAELAEHDARAWANANAKFANLSSTREAGIKNIMMAAYLAGHAQGRAVGPGF